jgi:hypothetical protein
MKPFFRPIIKPYLMKLFKSTWGQSMVLFTLVVSFSAISGCRKELTTANIPTLQVPLKQNPELAHKSKIETWLRTISMIGQIADIDVANIKTINRDGALTTRMPIGRSGKSFYFVTYKERFQVYGINTSQLNSSPGYEGIVDITDFQTLQKSAIWYEKGKPKKVTIYGGDPIMDAYNNRYPINLEAIRGGNKASYDIPIFFLLRIYCLMFGGQYLVAKTTDICSLVSGNPGGIGGGGGGGTGEEEATSYFPPADINGGGGNFNPIWANINNPSYFDPGTTGWVNLIGGLSYVPGNDMSWANQGVSNLDPAFQNTSEVQSLYYILNTQYNQSNDPYPNLTVSDMLDNAKSQQVIFPIIPFLLKAGANAAADALVQALTIYLTHNDVTSFSGAFMHNDFNKTQVAASGFEGLAFWRTPGGRIGRAAATATGDVLRNAVSGKYGIDDYAQLGNDFMFGFFSDLIGGGIGELSSRYGLPAIGKGLISKFGVKYNTVAGWLGGGLQQASQSFNHQIVEAGVTRTITITSNRKMVGWAADKIAVIGRSQDKRVEPFAQMLSQELGVHVHNIKEWPGFSSALTVEQNTQWVQMLKREGYTIFDVGNDPDFTPSHSPYYAMELFELFDE